MPERHPLAPLFAPRSVVLVGASPRPGSLGNVIWASLRAGGFRGGLHALNPSHDHIGDVRCASTFDELPSGLDLAVVCVPAVQVPDTLREAGRHGVRGAVVISAGFSEAGEAGRRLQAEALAACREHGLRMLGPNCVGLQRPGIGLNASFASTAAKAGDVALLSQSGAICTALVSSAWHEKFGLSTVISLGAAADVDFGEALSFLAQDGETRSILLYVEGIRDARSFMSHLRRAAWSKPVFVLKAGRREAGARAALSHTGALAGGDAAFAAALARSGAIRVADYEGLFGAARALGMRQRMRGDRLAIVTNGGGPGVLAADCAVDCGLAIARLSGDTQARLAAFLPPSAALENPVDIIGDADPARFRSALAAVLEDPGVDGVITVHCPTSVARASEVEAAIAPICAESAQPVAAVWMGRHRDAAAPGAPPAFSGPSAAVGALGVLAEYGKSRRRLMRTPSTLLGAVHPDFDAARRLIATVGESGRTLLTEVEAKAVLAACGLAVPRTLVARDAGAAVRAATDIGYPVVMKILSPDITHKSDVDGVRLDVRDAADVARQFEDLAAGLARRARGARFDGVAVQPMIRRPHSREILVGLARDAAFGPVVSFGTGGVGVELAKDIAVDLPPIDAEVGAALLARTRAGRMLAAYRDVPAASTEAVLSVLRQVSDMACHLPQLVEMDINPLLVDRDGALVLDARIVIDRDAADRPDFRYGHLAIHPYPESLCREFVCASGQRLVIRPMRAEDGGRETRFVAGLSPTSRYLRFLCSMNGLDEEAVAQFTHVDYDIDMALAAVDGGADGEFVGVARYAREADPSACEFAVVVADAWQRQGVGRRLVEGLMAQAACRGITCFHGLVARGNPAMLGMMRAMGFDIQDEPCEPRAVRVSIPLAPAVPA